MKSRKQIIKYVVASLGLLLSGCATIVNDPNIPLAVSFSDGSAGECTFKNKRGVWSSEIPTTRVYIRRSDDSLFYECSTKDGRKVAGGIRSEIEAGKMAASVIFWDFGITDAITDKHRTYQGNIVIPVPPPVPVPAVAPEPEPKFPVLETAAPEPQLEDKIMLGKTDDIISEEKKEWADERISITVERTGDQTAQPTKNYQVDRVWVEEELVGEATPPVMPGQPLKETFRPLPGCSFVLVEFVLLAKEATTSPVLVDSEGTRYMPIGVSPYSATTEFTFLVPKFTGRSKVLQSVNTYRMPGGEVDVKKDKTTGQLTIKKVAEPGAKFTAVWTVPKDVLVRCSEFKLHFGEAKSLVIDTLELRKE